MLATYWQHTGNMLATCRQHAGNILTTCWSPTLFFNVSVLKNFEMSPRKVLQIVAPWFEPTYIHTEVACSNQYITITIVQNLSNKIMFGKTSSNNSNYLNLFFFSISQSWIMSWRKVERFTTAATWALLGFWIDEFQTNVKWKLKSTGKTKMFLN